MACCPSPIPVLVYSVNSILPPLACAKVLAAFPEGVSAITSSSVASVSEASLPSTTAAVDVETNTPSCNAVLNELPFNIVSFQVVLM